MAVFGRRVAQVPVLVERRAQPTADRSIIVRQSAYESDGDFDLVQGVVNFVNFALRKSYFTRDELAGNALRAYHVDYYLAQVNNGGHSRYAVNSGMLETALLDCQFGLDAIGHGAADLHRRFLAFARTEPMRLRRVIDGSGFGTVDPVMETLDEEFSALDRNLSLSRANRDWLKSLPELKVVPDAEYDTATTAFAATNRDADARKAHRAKAALVADARDPLRQAMSYLCLMAPEPQQFVAWRSGQPGYDLGDGIKVVRFVVETGNGLYSAFFHPKVAVLFDDATKGAPVAQVPIEMVMAHVKRQTGENLMDALKRIPAI